jgi:two-component system, response regulator PdtaR
LTNRIEPRGLQYVALIYWFSIHNADDSDRETTGRMALADDNATSAFGKAMNRDMMRGDTIYTGWTMDIALRTRRVSSFAFPRNETRPKHAADMIGDVGFDVVEAGNADEAIAILESRPDIHVVFTDIQMPGSMDGLKLARFVRGRWPPIKIIATSGFVRVGTDDLPEGSRFLTKPYRPEHIVATLREMTAAA